ncbi:MAG TPA: hypothetical protein PKL52_10810 [Tenuifilaceae bacterium]|nr:hypothetical protein [Tenuifilaceae bacterium]
MLGKRIVLAAIVVLMVLMSACSTIHKEEGAPNTVVELAETERHPGDMDKEELEKLLEKKLANEKLDLQLEFKITEEETHLLQEAIAEAKDSLEETNSSRAAYNQTKIKSWGNGMGFDIYLPDSVVQFFKSPAYTWTTGAIAGVITKALCAAGALTAGTTTAITVVVSGAIMIGRTAFWNEVNRVNRGRGIILSFYTFGATVLTPYMPYWLVGVKSQ